MQLNCSYILNVWDCCEHRFMRYTSSATRNWYESIQICSIMWRTYIRSQACQAQSICNTSSDTTMEAILLSIPLGSFPMALILIIHALMTERSFLHNFYMLRNQMSYIASMRNISCVLEKLRCEHSVCDVVILCAY